VGGRFRRAGAHSAGPGTTPRCCSYSRICAGGCCECEHVRAHDCHRERAGRAPALDTRGCQQAPGPRADAGDRATIVRRGEVSEGLPGSSTARAFLPVGAPKNPPHDPMSRRGIGSGLANQARCWPLLGLLRAARRVLSKYRGGVQGGFVEAGAPRFRAQRRRGRRSPNGRGGPAQGQGAAWRASRRRRFATFTTESFLPQGSRRAARDPHKRRNYKTRAMIHKVHQTGKGVGNPNGTTRYT